MMRSSLPVLVICALAASACSSCAHRDTSSQTPDGLAGGGEGDFTFVFTAGIVGHLEPCGCSPDQRGGVGRAAQTVADIRKEGHAVLLVDGGDRFFASAVAPADPLAARQASLQARTMAEVTRLMRYDGLVIGSRDAAAAKQLFETEPLPPLLDTGGVAATSAVPSLVKDVGGVRVAVFGLGAGAAESLPLRAAAAKAAGARVLIAVAYLSFEEAKTLVPAAKQAGIHFILASRADVPETTESAALGDSDPPVIAVAARGEAVLRLDISARGPITAPFRKLAGQNEREAELDLMQQRIDRMREEVMTAGPSDPMKELRTKKLLELEERKAKQAEKPPPAAPPKSNIFSYAFIPMTPKLAQEPDVRASIDRYDATVAKENLEYTKAHPKACPKAAAGESEFVGDEKCAECHEEADAFWKTTPHAHAYATLADKNKQYNLACVSCHVTGFEQPGGACDLAQVDGRRNVQCESCHGPGSLHSVDGEEKLIARDTTEKICRKCHDPENSPHFKYKEYRALIIGPGHGEPDLKKKK